MHLVVVSHKICWNSADLITGYVTDGGFPLQMEALSELFTSTELVVPCEQGDGAEGNSRLTGNNLMISPLAVPKGTGIRRKIDMLGWIFKNGPKIWRAVSAADAVHTPIPGDVGTVGMIFALVLRKRLFVRHCGNWLEPKTAAERFWKWSMEKFAGPRNLMLATGGAAEPPSYRNSAVKWIFSTSLRGDQMICDGLRSLPADGKLRLIIACRQEEKKGTRIVIESLPLILASFPNASLDIVGGGSLIESLKELSISCGVADRVIFHGKVVQSKVLELLKQADVFCYPTAASEGFPKVVLEALSCGLPVITTRVSVLPELIGGGGGTLLDEPSPQELAEAVIGICSDQERYAQMSLSAFETARQYTLENWRDQIGELLRETWNVPSLSSNSQRLVDSKLA